jgi:hypothetical protein
VAFTAFAVPAAPGAELRIESKLQQRIELVGGFHIDRAAAPAVAPRRAAARDKLLAAEGRDAVTSIAASNNNPGSV